MDHEKTDPKSQKATKTYTMDEKVTTMDHQKTDPKSQKDTRGIHNGQKSYILTNKSYL